MVAKARTTWGFVEATTGRPTRIPDDIRVAFGFAPRKSSSLRRRCGPAEHRPLARVAGAVSDGSAAKTTGREGSRALGRRSKKRPSCSTRSASARRSSRSATSSSATRRTRTPTTSSASASSRSARWRPRATPTAPASASRRSTSARASRSRTSSASWATYAGRSRRGRRRSRQAPGDADALHAIGLVYLARGDDAAARRYLEAFLATNPELEVGDGSPRHPRRPRQGAHLDVETVASLAAVLEEELGVPVAGRALVRRRDLRAVDVAPDFASPRSPCSGSE